MFRRRDDGDGRVDIFGSGGGIKNTVTIVTTDTEAGAKSRGHTCGWRLPQAIQPEPLDAAPRTTLDSGGMAVTFLLPNEWNKV